MREYWEEAIKFFTDKGVTRELAITYIIVSIVLVVMAIVALVMRIMVIVKYQEGNHMKTKNGKTGHEVAREALDKAGLSHIKVEKAGWLRAFFIGNCYSITKKTIFLRRGIYDKDSITAVGLALQKVGLAKACEEGEGMTRTRNIMQILSLVGPILFVPVMLIGFVLDYALFHVFGVFSIVGIVVGFILVASGFISTILSLPVEKKGNDYALKIVDQTGILDKEERRVLEKVFKAYIIAYVCEFIVAILRIVQIVLEIVMNAQISSNNN